MPRHSRAVYRRRRLAVFGTTGVIGILLTGLAVVGLAPLPSAAVTPLVTLDFTSAPADIALPQFGMTAVQAGDFGLIVDSTAGEGMSSSVPIASIAKVVTALVVLDAHPIADGTKGDSISFDAADVETLNYSVANAESRAEVIDGMTMSEADAISVMLVKSANNYAWSLARWAFGSEAGYVSAANAWVASHGLTHTTIADASGLNPATQSSMDDLLTIGALALDNPLIATAVSSATISIDPIGELENSNKLLGTLGVNGIKTGTTDEAGACLLFSADLSVGDTTVRLVGVTLGAPDHTTLDAALEDLLTSIQDGFHVVTPVTQGVQTASAQSLWGASTGLSPSSTVSRLVWSSTPVTLVLPSTVGSTGSAGSTAGSATVTIGGESVVVDLIRTSEIDDPGLAWRVSRLGDLF